MMSFLLGGFLGALLVYALYWRAQRQAARVEEEKTSLMEERQIVLHGAEGFAGMRRAGQLAAVEEELRASNLKLGLVEGNVTTYEGKYQKKVDEERNRDTARSRVSEVELKNRRQAFPSSSSLSTRRIRTSPSARTGSTSAPRPCTAAPSTPTPTTGWPTPASSSASP